MSTLSRRKRISSHLKSFAASGDKRNRSRQTDVQIDRRTDRRTIGLRQATCANIGLHGLLGLQKPWCLAYEGCWTSLKLTNSELLRLIIIVIEANCRCAVLETRIACHVCNINEQCFFSHCGNAWATPFHPRLLISVLYMDFTWIMQYKCHNAFVNLNS